MKLNLYYHSYQYKIKDFLNNPWLLIFLGSMIQAISLFFPLIAESNILQFHGAWLGLVGLNTPLLIFYLFSLLLLVIAFKMRSKEYFILSIINNALMIISYVLGKFIPYDSNIGLMNGEFFSHRSYPGVGMIIYLIGMFLQLYVFNNWDSFKKNERSLTNRFDNYTSYVAISILTICLLFPNIHIDLFVTHFFPILPLFFDLFYKLMSDSIIFNLSIFYLLIFLSIPSFYLISLIKTNVASRTSMSFSIVLSRWSHWLIVIIIGLNIIYSALFIRDIPSGFETTFEYPMIIIPALLLTFLMLVIGDLLRWGILFIIKQFFLSKHEVNQKKFIYDSE